MRILELSLREAAELRSLLDFYFLETQEDGVIGDTVSAHLVTPIFRDIYSKLSRAEAHDLRSEDLYAACQSALQFLRSAGITDSAGTVMQLKLAIARAAQL